MERWDLLVIFELSMIFQDFGNMDFGPVYDFSVDYNTDDIRDILNIYKCFIRK